jgi:hypothetical protein
LIGKASDLLFHELHLEFVDTFSTKQAERKMDRDAFTRVHFGTRH